MLQNWDRAIAHLLLWEGGFADRSDPKKYKKPEYVNFGITLETYRHYYPDATRATIKDMTREQAIAFYSDHLRPIIKFDELPAGMDAAMLHAATMFGPNWGKPDEWAMGAAWFREKAGDDWAYIVVLMMQAKMHREESAWPYMDGWSDRFVAVYELAKSLT